jgi:hypothetical protein
MSRSKWKGLIPKPDWVEEVHHKKGNTQDIINVLVNAAKYNQYQAAREMKNVARELSDETHYRTLKNVWTFVKSNITYKVDNPGKEEIKNPAYLFHYGKGDCKSFSLMIAGILMNYKDISFSFRFTSYTPDSDYSHVYIVARIPGYNRDIILDATHTDFDDEVPYYKKKDYPMTEISHLHGVPNIRTKVSRPSVGQAFASGPRNVVNPRIDISNLTQGELKIALLKANLSIQANYYGDPTGEISKGIFFLDQAEQNGLENFKVIGHVDPIFNGLIDSILSAKSRHIQQVQAVAKLKQEIGISGPHPWSGLVSEEDLKKCIQSASPEEANFWYRNFNGNPYINYSGKDYKLSGKFAECFFQAKQKQWARNNIFEKEGFKKGSPSLLYEFAAPYRSAMNGTGQTKTVLHQSYVDSFAYISGIDRDNVSLYARNGVMYTAALNKIPDISPDYAIKALSEGYQYKGQPGIGEPISLTIAIIGMIQAALPLIISVVKSAGPSVEQNLNAYAKGLLGQSSQASIDDFNRKIDSAESLNTIVPLGLAALALGYFAFSKKSKS